MKKLIYFKAFVTLLALQLLSNSTNAQKVGTYYIQSPLAGKFLDLKGGNTSNGTGYQIYPYNGSEAQTFSLEDAGSGYFYIRSKGGKYIHVQNRSDQPKALALIWEGKGNNNTKWIFHPLANGNYLIQSQKGTYLDVQGGKSDTGTPVWLWTKNGGNAQQWMLIDHANNDKPTYPGEKVEAPAVGRLKYIKDLCPNTAEKHLKSGNRHFDGEVDFKIKGRVYMNHQKTHVYCDINLDAKSKANDTRINADWNRKLIYSAPPNHRIVEFFRECGQRNGTFNHKECKRESFNGVNVFSANGVLPPGGSEVKPISYHDGTPKTFTFTGSPFILQQVTIVGDTGTEDISDDKDCLHDSKIQSLSYSRGGAAIQSTVEGDLQVRLEKINSTPSGNNYTLRIKEMKAKKGSIHNGDCKRLQGNLEVKLLNTRNNETYEPNNGNKYLVNFSGSKKSGFDQRNLKTYNTNTQSYILSESELENIRLSINSEIRGCHKSGDFASDYHCNLLYNRFYIRPGLESVSSWKRNSNGDREIEISLSSTNDKHNHVLNFILTLSDR